MNVQPLKGYGSFDEVLRRGIQYAVGPIRLTVLVGEPHQDGDTLRLGVGISKRLARNAVIRNRVKRLLRVAAKAVCTQLENHVEQSNITTMILLWRAPVHRSSEISLQTVLPYVHKAVMKATTMRNNDGDQR